MQTQYIYPIISILSLVYISQKQDTVQSRLSELKESVNSRKVGCERNSGVLRHPLNLQNSKKSPRGGGILRLPFMKLGIKPSYIY